MSKKYDYIVVGSGLYGSILAHELTKNGKSCMVLEKRDHIGGNIYTHRTNGIDVHQYGAHIFHTDNKRVWDYINNFTEFNNYINSPVANFKGDIYNLPFNMNTFSKMWSISTPLEAKKKIEEQREAGYTEHPENLKEQAINLVGRDIFEKLIKGYTEKQWGRECEELPAFIIRRLPVRFTYNNNYFNSKYQGVPEEGYTAIIEKMLEGIDIKLSTDFLQNREKWMELGENIIYTGAVDEFFNYKLGALEYRKVRFETALLDCENFQGNAVVNYTDREIPFTRIIEHKHFNPVYSEKTVVSYEYSDVWKPGDEPYYPINDKRNNELYNEYKKLVDKEERVHFGGRLGEYKYYDMDVTIESALNYVDRLNKEK